MDKQELAAMLGAPLYRAAQIQKWLYRDAEFSEMSDLPAAMREELAAKYTARPAIIAECRESQKDPTKKYLFRLADGEFVEGVCMSYKHGDTLCVSTQAGCRMRCKFCASGADGLLRDLTYQEMLGQVTAVNQRTDDRSQMTDKSTGDKEQCTSERQIRNNSHSEPNLSSVICHLSSVRRVSNIVMMGMGEPLDNYDHSIRFIERASAPDGLGISRRNISLSTCGLADRMRRLADDGINVTLSVSLHATTDEKRRAAMPIAHKYSIAEVIGAAKYYFEKTGRRVIFEYALTRGNTHSGDAKRLKTLLSGFPAHVNLIMLNKIDAGFNDGLSRQQATEFCKLLSDTGVSATLRRSLGADIEGACGQLHAKRATARRLPQ
ncbi:MAG: radical SAM protein [Firmicutes bacterium]|nr:radical SAM protein [Bacillota bacterium]